MSPLWRRLRTLFKKSGKLPRPCAFFKLHVRSMMNAVWRMMSMMSAATSGPPCFIWCPISPSAGRYHQIANAMIAASVNPNGTMKRFIVVSSSLAARSSCAPRSAGRSFLRERSERLLLRVVVVEHHDQLRHREQIFQPLAETAELHFAAATLVVAVPAHQHTDRDRVQRLAFRHV